MTPTLAAAYLRDRRPVVALGKPGSGGYLFRVNVDGVTPIEPRQVAGGGLEFVVLADDEEVARVAAGRVVIIYGKARTE